VIPRHARVLDVGCGQSHVCVDMRRGGYTGRIVGIDYAPSAVTYVCDVTTYLAIYAINDSAVMFRVLIHV
jgi:2-polyprenyl-3-methyl-5-hydroxy-6-metoxy-1,4-benzoquinol methylase